MSALLSQHQNELLKQREVIVYTINCINMLLCKERQHMVNQIRSDLKLELYNRIVAHHDTYHWIYPHVAPSLDSDTCIHEQSSSQVKFCGYFNELRRHHGFCQVFQNGVHLYAGDMENDWRHGFGIFY